MKCIKPQSLGSLLLAFLFSSPVASAQGVITTVAGNGVCGYSGDGGPATSAMLGEPVGVAVDSAGNVYIAEFSNNRIRKVTPGGIITTVAGNGTPGYSGDGGPATSASLWHPNAVAVDSAGNLYIADWFNYATRKVTPDGIITTVDFGGRGVTVDPADNLYLIHGSGIYRITPGGIRTHVAGCEWCGGGFSGDGGPATSAMLNVPSAVAVDAAGNLYIADTYNQRIRKVSPDGIITTVAGGGGMTRGRVARPPSLG